MFSAESPEARYRFGPLFESQLGPQCPEITEGGLVEELHAAGWSFEIEIQGRLQLWKATDTLPAANVDRSTLEGE